MNLIGEHVDYNDGLVLPLAIDRSVLVAWARRDDDAVWAYSVDYGEDSRFNLARVSHAEPGSWANYVRGVVDVMRPTHAAMVGLDMAITGGDIPQGAGLSSSAAVEVAVAGALRDANSLPIDDASLAQLCSRAENEFVGVQSGIMDQFASTLCRRDHALLVDCRSLAIEHVPLRLDAAGMCIVIANSGVRRELVASAYNERRRECEQAIVDLRRRLSRPELVSLRDVTPGDIDAFAIAPSETTLRRARHVVGEIARVTRAVQALRDDRFADLGRLMLESHRSLKDDYEVSCDELDMLVSLAAAQPYVAGARLTGAGFGGCTVNIVQTDALATFERDIIGPYRQRTGLSAEMYVTSPQDGLRTWRIYG